MIGVLVNTGAVVLGSLIGLLIKKGIGEKLSSAIMIIIGFCTIIMGIKEAILTSNAIILVLSLVIGTAIGVLIKLGRGVERLGEYVEKKMKKDGSSISIASGFISATLLFCVGGMTIVGSINAGINGDNEILFTKSILDFISSIVLSSTMGIGVLFSAVAVFIIQGGLVLLSQVVGGILTDQVLINEISAVGGVLIMAIGLNLTKAVKFQVADGLPAFLVVVPVYYLMGAIGLI
jgi:uncharacterized membrane protein YqgA involved in biofilm formation